MSSPSLPVTRQPVLVWALVAVLLWASSLIHVCGLLTSGYPHPHSHDHHALEHSSPHDGKTPASWPHDHLSDCPLCVVHTFQVAPPIQAPQFGLALIGRLRPPLAVPVPKPARFPLYSPRAPPRALSS
jgi:hypothetical protein